MGLRRRSSLWWLVTLAFAGSGVGLGGPTPESRAFPLEEDSPDLLCALAAWRSPSCAQTIDPFMRMCQRRAKLRGRRSPRLEQAPQGTRGSPRGARPWLVERAGAVIDLQQDVDEGAALEDLSLEPVVEDVEDREKVARRERQPAARPHLQQLFVQRSSRSSQKLDNQLVLGLEMPVERSLGDAACSTTASMPTRCVPCRENSS